MNSILAVGFKVGCVPEVISLENSLSSFQEFVGGYIQFVPLRNNLCLICNENGILEGLPYNKEYGMFGDFLISKVMGNELVSLTREEAYDVMGNIDDLLKMVLRA